MNTPAEIVIRPTWVQYLDTSVQAGFPSMAEDHAVSRIDLMDELIKRPSASPSYSETSVLVIEKDLNVNY